MLDKTTLLKILLLLSFLATVIVIWSFATYSSQNGLQNSSSSSILKSEVTYIQISSKSKTSSSPVVSSSISSSSSSIVSSSSQSISSVSSSINSLPFPILENNISLVPDIELIIQKPDPEIQLIINQAKNRNEQEAQIDQAKS
jgi:hypothetical protein